jgi:hypothetical protein
MGARFWPRSDRKEAEQPQSAAERGEGAQHRKDAPMFLIPTARHDTDKLAGNDSGKKSASTPARIPARIPAIKSATISAIAAKALSTLSRHRMPKTSPFIPHHGALPPAPHSNSASAARIPANNRQYLRQQFRQTIGNISGNNFGNASGNPTTAAPRPGNCRSQQGMLQCQRHNRCANTIECEPDAQASYNGGSPSGRA